MSYAHLCTYKQSAACMYVSVLKYNREGAGVAKSECYAAKLLARLPTAMKVLGLKNLKKYFKIIILWFSCTAKATYEEMKYQATKLHGLHDSLLQKMTLHRQADWYRRCSNIACSRDRQARRQICFMAGSKTGECMTKNSTIRLFR